MQRLISSLVGSSSPVNFPSSPPKKTPRATRRLYDTDFPSSDPIDFPSYDNSRILDGLRYSRSVQKSLKDTEEQTGGHSLNFQSDPIKTKYS